MNHKTPLIVLFILLLSLSSLNAHSNNDTLSVLLFLKTGDDQLNQGQIDSAEHYYKKAGSLAEKIKFYPGFFQYASHYATLLYQQLRYQEALEISRRQLTLSIKLHDTKQTANAYNNIALQYHSLGDFHKTADYFIKALRLSETLNDPINQRKFYTNLASLFLDLNDKQKSLYYARKGYDVAVKLGDEMQIARSLVNLACSKILNNRFKEALTDFDQVISFGRKSNNLVLQLTGIINTADIYNRIKAYRIALAWNQKGLGLLNPEVPVDYEIHILSGLAHTYFNLRNYKKADFHFNKVIGQAETYLSRNELKNLYLLGSDLKEKIAKPQEALNLRKKYEVLSDSMLNESTQNSIQEQEIKYQSSLKEKALTQQKLKLARNLYELQKKDKWIMLFITVSAFFLTMMLLIYLVYRQRQKALISESKTQLLQAQLTGEEKERSRQARELHDGVGGILSAAKMQISALKSGIHASGTIAYEQTLSLINYAAEEVRNISHNLAPDIVLNEGLEKAVIRFCQRISQPGLIINHYIIGQIPSLRSDYELLLYRIIQEALNNVIKHSKARKAIVQLSIVQNILSITIEDDGIGFDTANVFHKGIGLITLTARATELGGNADVNSFPGQGTTIYLELDIEPYIMTSSFNIYENAVG